MPRKTPPARPHTWRVLERYRTWVLPTVVFFTGACVLVIEVVATRILAPFFGNTIYSYSSILGVVLAALSIGYYVGGRLADSRPDPRVFYGIIAAGGLMVIFLQILAVSLLPFLSSHLSITSGPLITSIILFLAPAILLGMLSPFAIKLQQRYASDKGIGTIAGEMFFWSTLGSIAGSLVTGFVLVPHFGIDRIILVVGFLLIALGIGAMMVLAGKPFRTTGLFIIAAGLVISLATPGLSQAISIKGKLIYSNDGLYERLAITEGTFNGRPTRFFQQDRSSSGAMYLDSDELVYDYTKYYSLYKLFKPDTRQALVIGGGAYSIPKALLQDLPEAQVDVSEIEPSLHDLSKKYFRVPETSRLANSTEDGRRLLARHDKQYDLIFSDVYYSLFSIPPHFTTQEFFQLAHNRLNQDGVFVANLLGSLAEKQPSFILSEMRTFQEAFPNSYFFATKSPNSTETQNIIFVGYKGDKRINFDAAHIAGSSDPTIANLNQQIVDPERYDLSKFPLLTDNYAPVEYLMTPVLRGATTGSIGSANMLNTIKQQLALGPRYVGSDGHKRVQQYLSRQAYRITPDISHQQWQETDKDGNSYDLTNIVMRLNPDKSRRIVVASHYDSKRDANLDRDKPNDPVPGANDSASGVAVLLDAARQLARDPNLKVGVDFVFFDGEEGLPQSGVNTQDWKPFGSTHFAGNLKEYYPNNKPEGGIVIDMVCDRDLSIHQEPSSLRHAQSQTERFWSIGNQIAPDTFQPTDDLEIFDDHTPLNQAGIPSFLVIDLKYPPFHTTKDTADKCSSKSLHTVSQTLQQYIRGL